MAKDATGFNLNARHVSRVMGAALPERAFTAQEIATMARLTLPEAKGGLLYLRRLGLVRKRTDPSKPTSNLYFRNP